MLSRLRAVLRTPLLAALLACWAVSCGGDSSAGPGPATSRAATAEIFMGDDQSGGAGDTLSLPLVVEVRDGQGNRLSGERVTFTVASGDGSVSPAEVLTRIDGTAMATFVLGRTLGAQSVAAAVSGLQPLTFSATAVTPNVTELVVVSGAGQSDQVATVLPAPLVLRTVDRLGYPVAGTYVSLSAPTGAGTLSPASGLALDWGLAAFDRADVP